MHAFRVVITFLVIFTLGGCASTAPTPPPTASAPPTSSPPTSAPPATPSAVPASPSPSPSATPSAVANGWQRVPDQPAFAGIELRQVVWTGSRFVAAGDIGVAAPGIADSTDGTTWHVQPSLLRNARIRGLAAGPGGVVAVGEHGSVGESWFSADGTSWTAAPGAASLRPDSGDTVRMDGVTPTASGWLAVGEEDAPCTLDCDGNQVRAIVWTSRDGLHWTRQPDSAALAHARMASVVRGGPGFVAVGRAPDHANSAGGAIHAVVWTSTDGRSWSRVPDAPVFHAPAGTDQQFGDGMEAIASSGGRFVAVGSVLSQDVGGSAVAWWSSDGRTWARGRGDGFLNGQMFDVAAVRGGFLATGPSDGDRCLGGIWSSADGGTWTCVAGDPTFADGAGIAVAASPQVEVVVGSVTGAAAIWTRPVP